VAVVLLLGPCLLYLIAFSIYPLIYSLKLSLTDLRAADATGHWIGLRNYGDLLRDEFFWNATKNSAIMVVSSVAIEVVAGVALAMFFNLHLKGSAIVRGILVLPMLITPIVVGVMWRSLLNPDWGLINWAIVALGFEQPNWLGSVEMAMKTLILVDAWQWTPFVFVIVYARLQTLPHEVIEAAEIDGASRWQVLWHIVIPTLRPTLTVLATFFFIWTWNEFLLPLVLLISNDNQNVSIALGTLHGQYTSEPTTTAAAALLGIVPTVIFFLVFQRTLMRGVTVGAIK